MTHIPIFLDVDGVLNAYDRPLSKRMTTESNKFDGGWPKDSWDTVTVASFPLAYSKSLMKHLSTLSKIPEIKIIWLTTWEDNAPELLPDALGIDGADWDVIMFSDDNEDYRSWWKFLAVKNYLKANPDVDKFVWIDDDLTYENDAVKFVRSHGGLDIAPLPLRGLTREEFHKIQLYTSDRTRRWILDPDLVLSNVHGRNQCFGRDCSIHTYADHHMASLGWPRVFREDGRIEWSCPHGIGHTDPNGVDYFGRHPHACDGCCMDPKTEYQQTDKS